MDARLQAKKGLKLMRFTIRLVVVLGLFLGSAIPASAQGKVSGSVEVQNVLSESGFHVLENPNAPLAGSRAYASEWIVKNRYEGKVKLFERTDVGLNEMEYPVTNMVLVGEKR